MKPPNKRKLQKLNAEYRRKLLSPLRDFEYQSLPDNELKAVLEEAFQLTVALANELNKR